MACYDNLGSYLLRFLFSKLGTITIIIWTNTVNLHIKIASRQYGVFKQAFFFGQFQNSI